MSKTCVVTLWNEHDYPLDEAMLNSVMKVVARHMPQAKFIDIYPQERVPEDAPAYKHPGWLEWMVRIQYHSGGALSIGCIQRNVGAAFEFHS